MNDKMISDAFNFASEVYAKLGVDVKKALDRLKKVSLSLHCWQGDDVVGFEQSDSGLNGSGLQVTGSYPGKARNIAELRRDLEKAYSLFPGSHRLNLHAIYGDFEGKPVERDAMGAEHFASWVDWAKAQGLGLDLNATLFSHPKAGEYTLSSKDKSIRDYWIDHVKRVREISAYVGRELKSPCIHNLWITDGSKDLCVDRYGYRQLLLSALDDIYGIKYDKSEMRDAVECKLFGIGTESFVVGSHEFYLGYAVSRGMMLCLDSGHFHPTETVSDKISAVLPFVDEILLHVSRGVRWDSDHVVILNDDLRYLCEELVRSGRIDKVHIGLDFFDGTINRIGAWALGARATLKGLLLGFLEPRAQLLEYEEKGGYFARLALLEQLKTLPFGSIWDYYCLENNCPTEGEFIKEIHAYARDVLTQRSRG